MLKRQVRVQKVSESNSKKRYRMHKSGILLPLCNLFTALYFSFEVYDICSDCPLVLICTRESGTFRHLKRCESGQIRWSEVKTKSSRFSVFVGRWKSALQEKYGATERELISTDGSESIYKYSIWLHKLAAESVPMSNFSSKSIYSCIRSRKCTNYRAWLIPYSLFLCLSPSRRLNYIIYNWVWNNVITNT